MKKSLCFLVICFFPAMSFFLSAQTAVEIDDLLKTKAISYGQAARFVLKAADVSELMEAPDAFRFAAERKWLPGNVSSGEEARLKGVSLLIMQSFDIKGGLFYSLFKNPHYAYREMVYQEIIQGRADPDMAVSGDMLLFLIGRILSRQGEDADFDTGGAGQSLTATGVQDQLPVEPPPAALVQPVQQPVSPQRAAEQEALVKDINTQLQASSVADTSARVTNEGVTISLSNIQFLANSSELPNGEKQKLKEIAGILQGIPGRKILVSGHTAMAGTAKDRLQTSYDRAKAVAFYLISLGVRKPDEIFAQGYGAERPIADNGTPEGMALNRRVEITILENQQ